MKKEPFADYFLRKNTAKASFTAFESSLYFLFSALLFKHTIEENFQLIGVVSKYEKRGKVE